MSNELIVAAGVDIPSDISLAERKVAVRSAFNVLSKGKSVCNLAMAQLLYEAKEGNYYEGWRDGDGQAYKSLEAFVQSEFNYSSSTTRKLIQTYQKFGVEFPITAEEMLEIGWVKLSLIASLVTEENLQRLLDLCRSQTYNELQESVKMIRSPLVEGESDPTQCKTYKFKVTQDQAPTIDAAIEIASELYGLSNDSYALEVVCANFMLSSLEEDVTGELSRCVAAIENAFNVTLKVETNDFEVIGVDSDASSN